jgi:hypothetical protein
MAMGKWKRVRATELWIPTTDLPLASSHPFYRRLNEVLRLGDFDTFVERACQKFYAARMGRPSLPPAVYFRLLLIGYFEGLDSEARHRVAGERFARAARLSRPRPA